MKKYNNLSANLIRVIKHLYDEATNAVICNSSIGNWFRTTAGVRQGCIFSPNLFNIFLERVMTNYIVDYEVTVSIGCRTITNLRFADGIDGLAGEEELARLAERLDKAFAAYGMGISAENTKLTTNNTSGINTEIKINGQKLETVTSPKYLGSVITEEGSKLEILSRIAQKTAALARLKPVRNNRSISFSSKIRLMRSLATSIFLYVCESWILTAEPQRRIQAMDMRCCRKILHISCKDHVTNEEVRAKIKQAIGPHEDLLTIVKQKMQTAVVWSCRPFIRSGQNHIARHSERGKKTRQTEEEVGRH